MRGDARVIQRLRETVNAEVSIPQPVVAEIAFGISRLPASKRRSALQQRFEQVLSEIARCPWSDQVSLVFGEIKAASEAKGRPSEDFDLAIGAHAMAFDATLVTANAKDFRAINGLRFEDWGA